MPSKPKGSVIRSLLPGKWPLLGPELLGILALGSLALVQAEGRGLWWGSGFLDKCSPQTRLKRARSSGPVPKGLIWRGFWPMRKGKGESGLSQVASGLGTAWEATAGALGLGLVPAHGLALPLARVPRGAGQPHQFVVNHCLFSAKPKQLVHEVSF